MPADRQDISFVKVSPKRMYESVVEQIEGMINRGELNPGDKLPPERDLGRRLGVSRAVLSQAFRVLEEHGVIQVRAGYGRSVRQMPRSSIASSDVVRSLENAAIYDLLEVRDVLECRIVELACERATDADLRTIEEVLERSGIDSLDLGLDEAFHLAVAQATYNVLFVNILHLSLDLLRKTRDRTLQIPGRRRSMVSEHRAIFEAVKCRDKKAAVFAVVRHLDGIKANLG